MSIFRYEDVIFNIFPQLAHLKRRGQTAKEIFVQNDPFSTGKGKDALDKNMDSQLIGEQSVKKSDSRQGNDLSVASNSGFVGNNKDSSSKYSILYNIV